MPGVQAVLGGARPGRWPQCRLVAAPRTSPAPAPRPAPVRDFPITSAQIQRDKDYTAATTLHPSEGSDQGETESECLEPGQELAPLDMVVMESEMQHRMPAWYDRYETSSGTEDKLRVRALCQKSSRIKPT